MEDSQTYETFFFLIAPSWGLFQTQNFVLGAVPAHEIGVVFKAKTKFWPQILVGTTEDPDLLRESGRAKPYRDFHNPARFYAQLLRYYVKIPILTLHSLHHKLMRAKD